MEIVTMTCAAMLLALAPQTTLLAGDGSPLTADTVCEQIGAADVILIGETHTDPVAHALEFGVLSSQVTLAKDGGRRVALGMEMLEADVQPAIDEYLAGLISEPDYIKAIRPWARYAEDYHPIVELARHTDTPVVATNAPERHVRMVARDGVESLRRLPAASRVWYDYAITAASPALEAKFRETMSGMHDGPMPNMSGMVAAQNLRDATMARRIAETLGPDGNTRVVHVNGSFHSADGIGIPEHLSRYAPTARVVTVTIRANGLDATLPASVDDIVILTPTLDG